MNANGDGEAGEAGDLSWDNLEAEFDSKMTDIKETYNKWKTKAMDQFLLNEDVYLYDFANRESKAGPGPFVCAMLSGKPCCIPSETWNKEDPRPPQMMEVIKKFEESRGRNRKKEACYHHFGVQHEYDSETGRVNPSCKSDKTCQLEDQCWHENDEGVQCEGKFNNNLN